MSDAVASSWRLNADCELSLRSPCIVGILNVTPDSFSDGGAYATTEVAAAAALRMVREGAHVIDVGGESTRPGARRVNVEEQIKRVVPVIQAIRAACNVRISIDTTRSEVAEAALDAGATIINDVSAGLEDDRMFALASSHQCGVILMHRLAPPEVDSYSDQYATPPSYDDVVAGVTTFLRERAQAAMDADIARESIAIDPGLGFGKTVAQNYELIARTSEIAALGFPVVCGASRKSFIGKVSGAGEPSGRVAGSVAAALAMYSAGARVFRVHDVAAHREGLAVMETILRSRRLMEHEQGIV
jgi:dihydropteroate synthase